MSDDDKAMGRIEEKIDRLAIDMQEMKDGKMAICQLHEASLIRIEAKLDRPQRQSKTEATPENGVSFGKFKAWGTPAIIVSVVIVLAAFQYYREQTSAGKVKEEAVAAASAVASKAAKVEHQQLDRDEVRKVLLEMIRDTQMKGTP